MFSVVAFCNILSVSQYQGVLVGLTNKIALTCLTIPRATPVLGPPHLTRLCASLKLVFFEAIEMQEEVYPVFEVIESAALMLLLC